MNLNLFFFIDINIDDNLIFMRKVIFLQNLYLCIFKAFFFKMLFYQHLSPVYDVRSDLITFYQSKLQLQIFPLRLFYSIIIDLRNTGALFQIDIQPYLRTIYLSYRNSDIRKQPLPPKTFYGSRNSVSGYFDRFPYRQS